MNQQIAAPALDAETKVSEWPQDHKDELRLWLRLLTCTTLIESDIRSRMRAVFEVTLPRFDLMAQLYRSLGGMTLGELSKRMMVSNGNLTGLVDRLVTQGLIDRRLSPTDRRAQIVTLTPEGRRNFRVMAETHEEWIAQLFEDLTREDIARLLELLGKLKSSAAKTARAAQAPG